MSFILTNIFYGGEIVQTTTGVGYNMNAVSTIVINDATDLVELRSQVYAGLNLVPSQFNLTIRARINQAQDGSYNYSLFWVDNEQIWTAIKSLTPSIGQYRTLELIVEAHGTGSDLNPTDIPGSSSYTLAPERTTHIQVPETTEQVEGGEEEEEENEELPSTWHLDEEEDETEDSNGEEGYETPEDEAAEIERIKAEWRLSVPFINRGMKHPCPSFNDDSEGPYADQPYYRKAHRQDEEFAEGQIFSSKKELRDRLGAYHIARNISIDLKNSSKTMYIAECKDKCCPWRLYARVTDSGAWMISTNPLEHECYGSATRMDHRQLTARIIADIL